MTSVAEITGMEGDIVQMQEIYKFVRTSTAEDGTVQGHFQATGVRPRFAERLEMASAQGKAETIDYSQDDVYERLMEMTNGRGPDRGIDAVGSEAHHAGPLGAIDKALQAIKLETDRPHVLREAIRCVRKGGTLSIPGVYIGMSMMVPFGTAMNKGLTMKMGQTHVQRYSQKLLEKIEDGAIDPSFVITHTCTLDEGPEMYKTFRDKEDGCIKVVLKP